MWKKIEIAQLGGGGALVWVCVINHTFNSDDASKDGAAKRCPTLENWVSIRQQQQDLSSSFGKKFLVSGWFRSVVLASPRYVVIFKFVNRFTSSGLKRLVNCRDRDNFRTYRILSGLVLAGKFRNVASCTNKCFFLSSTCTAELLTISHSYPRAVAQLRDSHRIYGPEKLKSQRQWQWQYRCAGISASHKEA